MSDDSDTVTRPDAEDHSSPEPQPKPPPRKRRRLVISCTECHRRKQKCDRGLPCANCTSRGKESSCRYETGKPVAKVSNGASVGRIKYDEPPDAAGQGSRAVDLGYTQNGASTLDVLRKIESASDGERLASLAAEQGASTAGVRERYKALIRQLPARTYVEDLVDFYFQDINWQYIGVDEVLFRELLVKWYNVPFSTFANVGPQGLEPMLREFPALLFQISACSLLYLRENLFEKFNSLKYADMTFDDLAMDYSESGTAILSLLGKRQMTLIAPLAGWVRAKFMKNCGMVTESWHQLGTAIRDAQEIGMHRDEKDPQPGPDDSLEESLKKLWLGQARRRVWIILMCWEVHMGSVLGRTPQCDFNTVSDTLPMDVMPSKEGHRTPMIPRSENSPPTPLTRLIWMFKLVRPLRDIIGHEKEGPFPKDFSHIDRIQQALSDIEAQMPAAFRLHNPDARFDHLPECWWLQLARPTLPQILCFGRLALHRPYIFTRATSRLEALKASFGMLDAQRKYFEVLKPSHHRMFSLFYGTFDAVVMVASIYILFPREHADMFREALQHFQWASERFEKMAARNQLARSALSVLTALYVRLKRVGQVEGRLLETGQSGNTSSGALPGPVDNDQTSGGSASDVSAPRDSSIRNSTSTQSSSAVSGTNSTSVAGSLKLSPDNSIINNAGGALAPTATSENKDSDKITLKDNNSSSTHEPGMLADPVDWSLPPDFDFGSIMPMYPIGDLAMNDLTGLFGDLQDSSIGVNGSGMLSADDLATGATMGWGNGAEGFGGNSNGHNNAPALYPSSAPNNGVKFDAAAAATASTAAGDPASGTFETTAGNGVGGDGAVPWQFGGDFGNDTIWNLFNQIHWSTPSSL